MEKVLTINKFIQMPALYKQFLYSMRDMHGNKVKIAKFSLLYI